MFCGCGRIGKIFGRLRVPGAIIIRDGMGIRKTYGTRSHTQRMEKGDDYGAGAVGSGREFEADRAVILWLLRLICGKLMELSQFLLKEASGKSPHWNRPSGAL
jgi:hypothetical protein